MTDADSVIRFVQAYCAKYRSVRKSWLFGSRATGAQVPKSDYDFAFDWEEYRDESWGDFTTQLRENNPTLYALDLIRIDQVDPKVKMRMLTESQVIYENPRK